MPYKDYEEKKARMQQWRKEKGKRYTKWLYDRRKLRFDDAERFHKLATAVVEISDNSSMSQEARLIAISKEARELIKESAAAEKAVGNSYGQQTYRKRRVRNKKGELVDREEIEN